MKNWISSLLGKKTPRPGVSSESFALNGFTEGRVAIKYVEQLSDADLQQLNQLLPWKCFNVDTQGRRFGDRAWSGKRETPEQIPDKRILLLNEHVKLQGKHVLEVGCFEGVHTIGLCSLGAAVTAIDSRIENVVKTIVRTAFFGYHPTVFKCDVERDDDWSLLKAFDVVHHVGVLYHLKDPVRHLSRLAAMVRQSLMLDTHFANPDDANQLYEVEGRQVRYKRYGEGGRADVFSGMYDYARWLTLEDIRRTLVEAGLRQVEIVEQRAERNGPRVLLLASRG